MKIPICHISTVHDPLDVRVFFKECLSLNQLYKVYLVVQSDSRKTKQGVEIIPLRSFSSRFIRIIIAPWMALIKALRTKAYLYHLHDPELLVIAPILRLLGRKVIFDKHENIDGQILSKHWMGPFWFRKLISLCYSVIEYFSFLFCHRIVIVIPEMSTSSIQNKTVLVRNYASSALFENTESTENERFSLIYVGGLTKIRGAREMICAFEKSGVDGDLYLAGKWESKSFEESCKKLIQTNTVYDLGFIEVSQVYEHLARCHVGLCLLHPVENFVRSIPVKVFEYYFSGQEVLLSRFSYWQNLFGERANYVNPLDIDEIADTLNVLYSKHQRGELANHSKWARENYSWEEEFKILASSYSELLN